MGCYSRRDKTDDPRRYHKTKIRVVNGVTWRISEIKERIVKRPECHKKPASCLFKCYEKKVGDVFKVVSSARTLVR